MKRVVLVFGLIAFIILSGSGHLRAALNLYVEDRQITLETPMMVINGNILIPLTVVTDYLGGEANWITPKEQVRLILKDQQVDLTANSTEAMVNGVSKRVEVAPEMNGDYFMVPLRFMADTLGMRIQFDAEALALRLLLPDSMREQAEALTKPEPVQSLKEIAYLGGPRSRVFIDVEDYSAYQTMLLVNPDRLVLDIQGISGEALPTIEVSDPLIKRIRSDWFNENTMRIVFDLHASTGYDIHRWPEGGLEVEFNYRLTDVEFTREEGRPVLWFSASDLPEYNVIYLSEPKRLVLDFQHASLIGGAKEHFPEDETVRRLRVSQFFPAITRVVFELNDDLTPLTVYPEDDRYKVLLYDGVPSEETLAEYQPNTPQPPVEEEFELEEEDIPEVDLAGVNPQTVLADRVIAVDPGHGGTDPGAIGPDGSFEKDVVLEVSLLLGSLLADAGAKVVYTRNDDTYISVFERPLIAEEAGADLFVSIHANSYVERIARGTETLFHPHSRESQILAKNIQGELVDALQLINRGLRPRSDLAVLNGAQMPAVIVEIAFINHPEEEILLNAPGFQQVAAEGIFNGILQFFQGVLTQ